MGLLEPDYTQLLTDIRDTLADVGIIVSISIVAIGFVMGFRAGLQR